MRRYVAGVDVADRPQLPPGYGISTGEPGMLPWSWAQERLVAARNYWVCTTRSGDRPHAVIHLESGDEVVVAEGDVERVEGGSLPAGFVDSYQAKYGHRIDTSDPMFGFYRLRPDRVLAWRESDFPTSATRFHRAAG
jgi:hypothetical protein